MDVINNDRNITKVFSLLETNQPKLKKQKLILQF